LSADELITLAYRKDYDALQAALGAGANINAADSDGRTPLMHAVLASDSDQRTIQFLVSRGADVNLHDKGQRWTALHFAARDQKLSIVEALVTAGAQVDAEDSFGNTPLWRAVMEKNVLPEIITFLLKHGASPDRKNHRGVSPRLLVERLGAADLLALMDSR
jgi:ankyrin repeat protein